MKNFVKKLSFVLAAAMVVTSVAVPVSASAATKGVTARYAGQKKSSTVVASKTIWAGGKKVNFDYVYGKKTSGVKGTWTSSDPSVVTVDSATGKATALKKGDVTVTFTPKSKKYAAVTVAVKARVRATSIILHDGADRTAPVVTNAALKVGESKTYYAELRTKTGTKSSYFVKATTSNASAAAVKNGAEDGSYKGDNYGRNVTVTANAEGNAVVTLVASPYSDDRTSAYDVKAEIPVTVKNVVSTSPVVQTERNEVTVSGVASGTSLVLVEGETFSQARKNIAVASTKANADGTNEVVLKLKDTNFSNNSQYTVFTSTGVKVGAFVAQSEKVTGYDLDNSFLKIDGADKTKAIGKIKLTNQWGHAYSNTRTTVSITTSGTSKDTATAQSASASTYSENKTELGAWYFVIKSSKTDDKHNGHATGYADFVNGDVVNVTAVANDDNQNYVQTLALTVNGTSSVEKATIYSLGFSATSPEVAKTNNFTEEDLKDSNKPTFSFFIAWPEGKAPANAPKVTVYLDDEKTGVDFSDGVYKELLNTNGDYSTGKVANQNDGEYKYTVALNNWKIAKGAHTFRVEYKDGSTTYTLDKQTFTTEADLAKKAAPVAKLNRVSLTASTSNTTWSTGKTEISTDGTVTYLYRTASAAVSAGANLDFYEDKGGKTYTNEAVITLIDSTAGTVFVTGTFDKDGKLSISKVEADRTFKSDFTTENPTGNEKYEIKTASFRGVDVNLVLVKTEANYDSTKKAYTTTKVTYSYFKLKTVTPNPGN